MDSDDVGCNGVVAVAVAVKRKFVSYLPFSIGHKSEMNTKFETIFLFVHCFVVVVVVDGFSVWCEWMAHHNSGVLRVSQDFPPLKVDNY